MSSPNATPADPVIGRYDSLDDLFVALANQAVSTASQGGSVRVHPKQLPEKGLADYIRVRERIRPLGLRLVITPAVGPHAVELRRLDATDKLSTPAGEVATSRKA